jgi:DNA-binding phage protein
VDEAHAALAERIRELAAKRGVALSTVADLAGVGRGHFFAVLAGEASPTLKWIVKVADALDVYAGDLLDRTKPDDGRP